MPCEDCQRAAEENAGLHEEVAGLLSTTRRQARTIAGLESELRKQSAADPAAVEIQAVLDNWRHHCGHPKAKTPAGGKRWLVVKKALKDHTLAELLEAIEGLALVPYVGNHGRKTQGKPNERYDDVEHALRDEPTIQRFRSYRARALTASSWVLYDQWDKARATSDMYSRAMLSAQARERAEKRAADKAFDERVMMSLPRELAEKRAAG